MSRSNDDSIKNPATKFFEWNGDKGGFKWYDKTKKENVAVPYPFRFLVLDQLMTIKGYSKENESGFYSNELRDSSLKTGILSVRTKNGIEMEGTYEQVKAQLSGKGACYSKSVYIAYFDSNKKLVIGCVHFHGASIGPWIDFCKSNEIMKIGVQVKSHKEGEVGKVVFQSPVFEPLPITKETNDAALELDKQLQEYLKYYFSRNSAEVESSPIISRTEEITEVLPEDIKPLIGKDKTAKAKELKEKLQIEAAAKAEQESFIADPNNDLPF